MKRLKDVTIVCVDCVNYEGAIAAIMKSLEEVKPDKVIFFTNLKFESSSFEVVNIGKVKSKNHYSEFMMKRLYKYITTQYVLIIQNDGYVLSGKCWDVGFRRYDYIGAKWLFPDKKRNVGNGGFSLRTKKLLDILGKDNFIQVTEAEDDAICRLYGPYMEQKYGIRFAPERIADKFSFELNEATQPTFGFHGHFHHPFREVVIIKRTAAFGDIIMCEPLIDYYSKQGYRVYLDTSPDFFQVFAHYSHIVKHISELKKGTKITKTIDLDMSYERTPKQLVLKSYYDAAGVTDGEIRNSRLFLHHLDNEPLFEKYVVIHADETGMPHRNINGIQWFKILEFLQKQGFNVIQVGRRKSKVIPGAIQFNAATKHMMMFLIKGASMFIGLDSGLAQVAVGFSIPSVIFFGSVNPAYRYANFEKIRVVHTNCPLNKNYYCYHELVDFTVGKDCEIDKDVPPCSQFSTKQAINAIKELL